MIIGILFIVGCTGKPISFKSVNPRLYQDIKDKGITVVGEASGFQLLLLIPININDRHKRAYDKLLAKSNGGYITNVKIKDSWTYWLIGTEYSTTITATVYPRITHISY